MHVQFSFHHVSRDSKIDKAVQSQVRKLERLLTRFSPDLIRLHGVVEFTAAHQGPVCSLNLWLPTSQLHFRHEGDTVLTAIQDCFNHLIEQVKKHKQFLRREGEWKRRRYKFKQEALELQAAEVRVKDRQALREYLDLVLPQLEKFVERELRYRRMGGMLAVGEMQREEVVDEVVARALEEAERKPADSVSPFHRLVSEAIVVLNGPFGKPSTMTPQAAAEASMPGEPLAGLAGKVGAAHLWRQARTARAASDSAPQRPPDSVELLLGSLPALDRQVYVLHALEGFSWEETARVLEKSPVESEEIFRRVSGLVAAALRTPAITSSQPGAG